MKLFIWALTGYALVLITVSYLSYRSNVENMSKDDLRNCALDVREKQERREMCAVFYMALPDETI